LYQLFSESIKGQTVFLDSLKRKRIDLSKVIDASKMQISPEDMDAEMSEGLDENSSSGNDDQE
jgi:hypothetical protein